MLKAIKLGSKGPDVLRWQTFLRGRSFVAVICDGVFDERTDKATRAFQREFSLVADGVVGNATLQTAVRQGMPLLDVQPSDNRNSALWPPAPSFKPMSESKRVEIFGRIPFEAAPTKSNPEAVKVDPAWVKANIVTVDLPHFGKKKFHKLAAPQVEKLFAKWAEEGLWTKIESFNGSYVPRYKRGSTTSLSNHAWGTAFDINAPDNALGVIPPAKDEYGSVRELVPSANALGFYWGGHFSSRPDGMHFEIAYLI